MVKLNEILHWQDLGLGMNQYQKLLEGKSKIRLMQEQSALQKPERMISSNSFIPLKAEQIEEEPPVKIKLPK